MSYVTTQRPLLGNDNNWFDIRTPRTTSSNLTFQVNSQYLFGVRKNIPVNFPQWRPLFPENGLLLNDIAGIDTSVTDKEGIARNRAKIRATKMLRRFGRNVNNWGRWWLTNESLYDPADGSEDEPRYSIYDIWEWPTGSWSGYTGNPDDFDLEGLLLTSPELKAPELDAKTMRPHGLDEFVWYLRGLVPADVGEAVNEMPYFFYADPEMATVHVQMGIRSEHDGNPVDIPLDVLRHLAWICVLFEDVMALLQRAEHQGYRDTTVTHFSRFNRTVLMAEDWQEKLHHCEEGRPFSPVDALIKIFNKPHGDDGDSARQAFYELMTFKNGDLEELRRSDKPLKPTLLNFENIAPFRPGSRARRHDSSKTVEFRHMGGAHEPDFIASWIMLLTALFRAAERKAAEKVADDAVVPLSLLEKLADETPRDAKRLLGEASKYSDILRHEKRTLRQFFDLLELPQKLRELWYLHASVNGTSRFSDPYGGGLRSSCENPRDFGTLACQLEPVRDCHGFGEDDLLEEPWDKSVEVPPFPNYDRWSGALPANWEQAQFIKVPVGEEPPPAPDSGSKVIDIQEFLQRASWT